MAANLTSDQHTPPIDLYHHEQRLDRDLAGLANDADLLPEQRRTLLRFIADARIGRTVHKGAKRRIGAGRCRKMLHTLRRFALAVPTPFESVTVDQMERFILGIEQGTVAKLVAIGGTTRYSPETVLDFKKILRKFYRWLLPKQQELLDELTGWFDTREVAPELKTFGLDEVHRMARALGCPQGQAFIYALFDGGYRASEWRNVLLSDLEFRPDRDGVLTCFTRVRVSKTKPRTISLPLATDAVQFWVARHPDGGPIGADGRVQAKNPAAPLFTWSYHYCRKLLYQLGRDELGQRLYFHRFRHASATWYAKRLGHYQLTARFGWTMGSKALQRYIDHSGVLAEDTASVVRRELPSSKPLSGTRVPPASQVAAMEELHRKPLPPRDATNKCRHDRAFGDVPGFE